MITPQENNAPKQRDVTFGNTNGDTKERECDLEKCCHESSDHAIFFELRLTIAEVAMPDKPPPNRYEWAAARRVFLADPTNSRATSILSQDQPVYLASGQSTYPEIPSSALDSVGLITYFIGTAWKKAATAWPIGTIGDETIFATAGHVLQVVLPLGEVLSKADLTDSELRPCKIGFPNRGSFDITWICAAEEDVALFRVQERFVPLSLEYGDFRGREIVVAGYPLQEHVPLFSAISPDYIGKQFLSPGYVWREQWASTMLQHAASTVIGYSGGPVFDPKTGKVVGLHVWGSTGNQDMNDSVPITKITQDGWLNDIIQGRQARPPSDAECMVFEGVDNHWESAPSEPSGRRLAEMMAPQTRARRPRRSTKGKPQTVAIADQPDRRDHPYRPGFSHALPRIIPSPGPVGEQMDEGSCAAFAVAAAIENQLARAPGYTAGPRMTASVRMLDRMARPYDRWLDDTVDGTSLRAVLRGFYENGVCGEAQCPFLPRSAAFFLTRDRAKDARKLTLGGYAKVGESVSDMRMAVQEAGAVICTARIHRGWHSPERRRTPLRGVIPYQPGRPPDPRSMAVHAFVVDGYDANGFIVQSSWGPDWGCYAPDSKPLPGHALWSFDDWSDNILDAWVIRLAPSSEKAFSASAAATGAGLAPRRMALLGHIARSESTGLVEDGTLSLGRQGLAETAAYLASKESRSYDQLLLILPDPLWGEAEIARLALQMTLQLKAREIYPFHLVHGLDDMLACRLRLTHDAEQVAARYLREGDSRDRLFERRVAPVLRTQIDSYARGARLAMRQGLGDALSVLALFASFQEAADDRPLSILSFGLGGLVAEALLRHPAFSRTRRHLCIAPVRPIARTGTIPVETWHLDQAERAEADLPGYDGCWGDLAAAAWQYPGFRAHPGLAASRPQALIEDRRFVPRLAGWLRKP